MTILNDTEVILLREDYANGASQQELADAYGVSQTNVSKIVLGHTRLRAGGPLKPQGPAEGMRHGRTVLSTATIEELRADRELGFSYSALARMYGTSVSHARAIALNEVRRHG